MRLPVTMPGYHQGRIPANKGKKYPAEILTAEEASAPSARCPPAPRLGCATGL